MVRMLVRIVLLTVGLAASEIGLSLTLGGGAVIGWLVVLGFGMPLVVAGSAGFMAPLLSGARQKGRHDA